MAGGVFIMKDDGGKVTLCVICYCLVAAIGGLMFGYDLGVSGGVTTMDPFLIEFFQSVYDEQQDGIMIEDQYCKYDSKLLAAFISSVFISAMVASLFASETTKVFGHKVSMVVGGITYFAGAILSWTAMHVTMLFMGRLLVGVGVGYTNQSALLYLSEMAPTKSRGALNLCFQLAVTFGVLVANLVNSITYKIREGYGWRVSLGLASVPAIIMTTGSVFLPDTPNSLIERGHKDTARSLLQKVRGTNDVDEEFDEIIRTSEASKQVKHQWNNIMEQKHRPQVIMAIFIPFFQQFTGINFIQFYAPAIFSTLGFGPDASLMSALIAATVSMVSTLVAIFTVDKQGRRILFLEGGIQMIISQTIVGVILGHKFGVTGEGILPKGYADLVLFFICSYLAGFGWSWGPLGWLVPSEIFPLEVRSAGQAINVFCNMFFTFLTAQMFHSMLCFMKFGLFFFFAGFQIIMTTFIYLFLPETKNIPIERINMVWKEHWFWSKYIQGESIVSGQPTRRTVV